MRIYILPSLFIPILLLGTGCPSSATCQNTFDCDLGLSCVEGACVDPPEEEIRKAAAANGVGATARATTASRASMDSVRSSWRRTRVHQALASTRADLARTLTRAKWTAGCRSMPAETSSS